MSAPTMISIADLAKRWRVDRKTLYGMIERGELAAVRIGRLLRIPLRAVESLESQDRAASEGK